MLTYQYTFNQINMTKKSVIGVVFSKDRNEILLTKRRDVPVWVLPGGGVEKNEDEKEAIKREIFEETGFNVHIKRKVGIYIPINKLTKKTHLYECSINSGIAKISNETKEIKFFPINNLPKLMPPPYDEWIKDAHQNNKTIIKKKLSNITYKKLLINFILHPTLVIRFLLSRIGIYINS